MLAYLFHNSILYLTIVAETFESQKRRIEDHVYCTVDHLLHHAVQLFLAFRQISK